METIFLYNILMTAAAFITVAVLMSGYALAQTFVKVAK